MCRLFLSMNHAPDKTREYLDRFFHISSIGDEDLGEPNIDGYGIVSLKGTSTAAAQRRRTQRRWQQPRPRARTKSPHWNVYKAPYSHMHDPKFESAVSGALSKPVPDAQPIVLAQTRLFNEEFSVLDSIPTKENTPPYVYRDGGGGGGNEQHVFFHNGQISNFTHHRAVIIENIAPKYRTKIRGKTDSEYMFYLYLTFWDASVRREKHALFDMIDFFKKHHMNVVLNVIYANTRKILVSRVLVGKNKLPPPLYVTSTCSSRDAECAPAPAPRVLITSRKISPEQRPMKKGEIMEFDV